MQSLQLSLLNLRSLTCFLHTFGLNVARSSSIPYLRREKFFKDQMKEMSTSTTSPDPQPQTRKRKRSVSASEEFCLTPWRDSKSFSERNYTNVDQKLHHEILAFAEYIKPTYEEKLARRFAFTSLQKVIVRALPECTVGMFGSLATGLNLPKADMDISVSSPNIGSSAGKKRSAMFRLAKRLKDAGVVANVEVNHFAKVPVIICQTSRRHGDISVDITLNNADGLQAVDAVTKYLSEMPALRPLVLVVKAFLRQRDFHSAQSSGLGSYAVICMVISFLQLNPTHRPADHITHPFKTQSLGLLLRDFMLYYGVDFPYTTSYISVTEGKLLPKSSAPWINTSMPQKLAVQCLVNPDVDVGRASNRIPAITKALKEAAEKLSQVSLDDSELLGSIVAIDQSTWDHRRHLHQLYSSRAPRKESNLNEASHPRNALKPNRNLGGVRAAIEHRI